MAMEPPPPQPTQPDAVAPTGAHAVAHTSPPGGSLQTILVAAACAPLSAALAQLEMFEPSDLEMTSLDELQSDLSAIGFVLSKAAWKRMRQALGTLDARGRDVPADAATRAPAAAAREAAPAIPTAARAQPTKPAQCRGAASIATAAAAATAGVGLATGDVVVDPAKGVATAAPAEAPARPRAHEWSEGHPRLSRLLTLLSPEEGMSKALLALFANILAIAGIGAFEPASGELMAEQIEHSVLEPLDRFAAAAEGGESESGFEPREDGARGVRAHVRGLMKMRDAYSAARERAAREEASQRESDLASVRLWGGEGAAGAAAKAPPGKTLEHTRARERIDAVVQDPEARKALQELQNAVHVPKGEQAFLDLKETSERSCEALANLLHHEDVPQPSSGMLSAAKARGLAGLEAAIGGAVGRAEMAAWVACATIDVQQYFFKAVVRCRLKGQTLDNVDSERLVKAAYYGKLAPSGVATGAFKLSEVTNPSDTTSIVGGKGKEGEARRLLDGLQPVAIALAAAHPRDSTVHETLGLVHQACVRGDGVDSKVVPEIVDAVYGSFLRQLSEDWSHFQTAAIAMPTVRAVWEAAEGAPSVKHAWQQHTRREMGELRAAHAASAKDAREAKELCKGLAERVKRLESRQSTQPQPGGGKPGAPTASSKQKLKDDVFYSGKRLETAKKEHETAVAAGGSDVAAKKTAMDKAAKEAKDAKAALAAAEAHKPPPSV